MKETNEQAVDLWTQKTVGFKTLLFLSTSRPFLMSCLGSVVYFFMEFSLSPSVCLSHVHSPPSFSPRPLPSLAAPQRHRNRTTRFPLFFIFLDVREGLHVMNTTFLLFLFLPVDRALAIRVLVLVGVGLGVPEDAAVPEVCVYLDCVF